MDKIDRRERIFRDALRLYNWFITKSYIDIYNSLLDTHGKDCAYTRKVKEMFFDEEKDKEFLRKINELYREYDGEEK